MAQTGWFSSDQQHDAAPGGVWRPDRAISRTPESRIGGLCHWAGEPAGHLGAESPTPPVEVWFFWNNFF